MHTCTHILTYTYIYKLYIFLHTPWAIGGTNLTPPTAWCREVLSICQVEGVGHTNNKPFSDSDALGGRSQGAPQVPILHLFQLLEISKTLTLRR